MKHLLKFSVLLIALSVFVGCNKDDDSSNEDDDEDIAQLVENFVTPELLQSLTDLGYDFNDGQDTPDIAGTFLFSTTVLSATNIESDFAPGSLFNDVTMAISNLNPEARTFDFILTENNSISGETQASFYSGNGNEFSAYVRSRADIGNARPIILYAISGTIAEGGITNAQYSLLMLDDDGDPDDILIENSEGRLFVDKDGTAARQ